MQLLKYYNNALLNSLAALKKIFLTTKNGKCNTVFKKTHKQTLETIGRIQLQVVLEKFLKTNVLQADSLLNNKTEQTPSRFQGRYAWLIQLLLNLFKTNIDIWS